MRRSLTIRRRRRFRRGLRVRVFDELAALPDTSGHGRMWRSILRELDGLAQLELVSAGTPAARAAGDGVWLADGHAQTLPETPLPVVAHVHEAPWGVPELRGQIAPEFAAYMERQTAAGVAGAQRLITPSQASRRQLAAVYDVAIERIHAVAHGVDAQRFSPARAAAGQRRIGAPYVLFVGSLVPRKNLPVLRAAMARLAAEGFAHKLCLVLAPAPDRADQAALEAAAVAELPGAPGRIVRVDRPSDEGLAELMAGADALCLPSQWEGFGLPALEALAAGTVAVVSDRGATPEVVGDAGITAAPTEDAITAALRDVLSDRARADALGRAARERALGLSWRAAAEGWLAVLERAARDGARVA